jgi:hypothetical protein
MDNQESKLNDLAETAQQIKEMVMKISETTNSKRTNSPIQQRSAYTEAAKPNPDPTPSGYRKK